MHPFTKIPHTLESIEKLRKNSQIAKNKHFIASKRGQKYHMFFGVPIVIINVLLGSTFVVLLNKELPDMSKWIGALFSLVAAAFGVIQTFFNFQKTYEGHRKIGNQYLNVASESERIIALYFDQPFSLDELSAALESLYKKYHKVNSNAESFPTNSRDYEEGKELQELSDQKNPPLVPHYLNLHKSFEKGGAVKERTSRLN